MKSRDIIGGGCILVAIIITLFLFLAHFKTKYNNEKQYYVKELKIANDKITAGVNAETLARKKEGLWIRKVDSLKKELEKKPKVIYKTINEEINRDVDNLNDGQLDSILTNYRYEPLPEEGGS